MRGQITRLGHPPRQPFLTPTRQSPPFPGPPAGVYALPRPWWRGGLTSWWPPPRLSPSVYQFRHSPLAISHSPASHCGSPRDKRLASPFANSQSPVNWQPRWQPPTAMEDRGGFTYGRGNPHGDAFIKGFPGETDTTPGPTRQVFNALKWPSHISPGGGGKPAISLCVSTLTLPG